MKVDPGQIEQVIVNLAVNARDAMPKGGELIIRTSNIDVDQAIHLPIVNRASAYVMLEMIDNGTGMDQETLSHCLEPFYTTKEAGKGTGLGLSTVYAVIEKSGGHLELTSEIGVGTAFRMYFPKTSDGVEKPVSTTDVATGPMGDETILLVEDDAVVRDMMTAVLRKRGYQVIESCSGDEAIKACGQRGNKIDLLITNIVMPHMNGRELADELIRRQPALKVIYMSGYDSEAVMKYGIGDTDGAFLQKPFAPVALITKVREVLDRTYCDLGNPDSRAGLSL